MKLVATLFFAIVVFFVSAYGQERDPQVYCGRRLARMMAEVCYRLAPENKRSGYEPLRLGYEPEFGWPWIAATRADGGHARPVTGLVGLGNRDLEARGKRGIVEDCCENSCSIDTLMSYC